MSTFPSEFQEIGGEKGQFKPYQSLLPGRGKILNQNEELSNAVSILL